MNTIIVSRTINIQLRVLLEAKCNSHVELTFWGIYLRSRGKPRFLHVISAPTGGFINPLAGFAGITTDQC